MPIAWVDFETRSNCDLLKKGAYNYAQDISTDILCMAYAIDDGEVQLWLPGQQLPDFTGYQIRAHNAAFERLIFWYVLQQDYPLESFYCTAVQAAANCLPRSLEDVGRAVSSKMRKDYRGAELVRKCCIPPFNTELLPELYDYCLQDVRTMRAVSQSLRDLTPEELSDYHINERINDRGVLVDVDLCKAAMGYAAQELQEAQAVFQEITGLPSVRSPRMKEWVWDRVGTAAQKLMSGHAVDKNGKQKRSIDKDVRKNLLTLAEESIEEVSEDVAEVIRCADDIWASSTAKFGRLASLADEEDHRVRGAFVFNGGSATGRAASYGAQVHNFPRQCADDPAALRDAMVKGVALVPAFGPRVSTVLKSMLRPSFMPAQGNVFVVADWSAIEGRVNPWLANTAQGEVKLDVYRAGRDPYIVNAAALFGAPYESVTKEQRFVGKVQELALGFLGGAGAFAKFAPGHDEAFVAKAVKAWRRVNPWAVNHGQLLEEAYTRAMRNKGHEFSAGRVTYMFDGEHLWYALPSGRVLRYPYAKMDEDGVSYLKASWKPAAGDSEWPRGRLWKGLALENTTQATANDLLRNSLRQIDGVALHVHDEIVVECRAEDAPCVKAEVERIMCEPPPWAKVLPLAVEAKIMTRYGK
jgi:DNA polymerase